jgi:5'-nucleotidase
MDRPRTARLVAPLILIALLAGCGSDDTGDAAATTPSAGTGSTATSAPTSTAPADTTPATDVRAPRPPGPLRILVTNDDGVNGPGLEALAAALAALPDVEVTVAAPLDDRSGSGMRLTFGDPAAVVATPATTTGGRPATAVDGYPADSVRWAITNTAAPFDLVVSGANPGQNVGDSSGFSGTVGAARYAAQQGIPAVAVSQGATPGQEVDRFDISIAVAIEWITANRAAYESGEVSLISINSPMCPGAVDAVVEVPLGLYAGRNPSAVTCDTGLADPVDDVDAFTNGLSAITELPVEL